MGFYYRLKQAKQNEQVFLEKQNEFLEHSKSFLEENKLSDEQHEIIRSYLLLRTELAVLWYQVGESCPSEQEARQYYQKSAQLSYFPAQKQINVEELPTNILSDPIDKLAAEAKQFDPVICFAYAAKLELAAKSAGQTQASSITLRQQAFRYYEYAAIQRYPNDPPVLTAKASEWIGLGRTCELPSEQAKYFELTNQYFNLAMEQGFADAFCHKGLQYFTGVGEKQDSELALKYFREAEKRGSAEAVHRLSAYYLDLFSVAMKKSPLNGPELLASILLDGQLGVRRAVQLAQELKEQFSLTVIKDTFIRELISLVPHGYEYARQNQREISSFASTLLPLLVGPEQQDEALEKADEAEAKASAQVATDPLTEAVRKGYPLTLELFLQRGKTTSADLLPIALDAYAREQSEFNKQQYKRCVILLIKNDPVDLNDILKRCHHHLDLEILSLMLAHESSHYKDHFVDISHQCEPSVTLKLLAFLSLKRVFYNNLSSLVSAICMGTRNPLLQAILRLLLTPESEEENAALYEAQLGHNALGLFLRLLYINVGRIDNQQMLNALQKIKITFENKEFFNVEGKEELQHKVTKQIRFGNDVMLLWLLIQSPIIPPPSFLENILRNLPHSIYALIRRKTENLTSIDALLGTQVGDVVTLRTGFLSELINYLVEKAVDDEKAFEFTLELINTGSPIVITAINERLCLLVRELIDRIASDLEPARAFKKLSLLLQRRFFGERSYQSLLDLLPKAASNSVKYKSIFQHMLALVFVAVRQGVTMSDEQKVKFIATLGFKWIQNVINYYNVLREHTRPIITELLLSSENSAFWQVVDGEYGLYVEKEFSMSRLLEVFQQYVVIHQLRRDADENYRNLERQLSDPSSYVNELIAHDNRNRLSGDSDYIFLLQENKKDPAKVLFLLFICQKLQIAIPEELLKELRELRHKMIEFLQRLKSIDLTATQTQLLDITNHEAKEAVHNENNRTYLSTVFRLKRGLFAPSVRDPNDAIAKAYQLLEEVNKEIQQQQPASVLAAVQGVSENEAEKKKSSSYAAEIINNSSVFHNPISEEKKRKEFVTEYDVAPRVRIPRPNQGGVDEDSLL